MRKPLLIGLLVFVVLLVIFRETPFVLALANLFGAIFGLIWRIFAALLANV